MRAWAAAIDFESLTSNSSVSREPGGHPRARAASNSGPCAFRSLSVAYTKIWERMKTRHPAYLWRPLPRPPRPSSSVPLKLWEGSEASRTAKCRPMPEEQPVMSTTVGRRSMWKTTGVENRRGPRGRLGRVSAWLCSCPQARTPPFVVSARNLKAESGPWQAFPTLWRRGQHRRKGPCF